MSLAVTVPALPPTRDDVLRKLFVAQEVLLTTPQIEIPTQHILHGGMYSRTIKVTAGNYALGALIKVPTILIFSGRCAVFTGEGWAQLDGYQVIAASKGRKQICIVDPRQGHTDTDITMIFKTDAKTVEEAESEFTDEADILISRRQDNHESYVVTGE